MNTNETALILGACLISEESELVTFVPAHIQDLIQIPGGPREPMREHTRRNKLEMISTLLIRWTLKDEIDFMWAGVLSNPAPQCINKYWKVNRASKHTWRTFCTSQQCVRLYCLIFCLKCCFVISSSFFSNNFTFEWDRCLQNVSTFSKLFGLLRLF